MCIPNKTWGLLKENGFSLLEVLLAIVIMSSVVFLALPDIKHECERIEEEQYIDEFKADLYVTSNQAISRGEKITIYFDTYEGSYLIKYLRPYEIKKVMIPSGFSFDHNFSAAQLSFNAQGHINKSGTLWIYDPDRRMRHITIYLAGGRFFIE